MSAGWWVDEQPQLQQIASEYEPNKARAFVQGYDGGLPVNMYERGFQEVYQMARQGVDFDTTMRQAGSAGDMFTPWQRQQRMRVQVRYLRVMLLYMFARPGAGQRILR